MNAVRIQKAIEQAKEQIAIRKLKEKHLDKFINSKGQKCISKVYFTDKSGKLSEKQREEITENERICNQCGYLFYAIIFHNDLPPDDTE